MGPKNRTQQPPAPQQPEPSSSPPWVLIGGVVAIAALALLLLFPTSSPEAPMEVADNAAATPESEAAPAAAESHAPEPEPTVQVEPVEVRMPPPDAPMPPYPFVPNMAPRPADMITEVYEFAGRRPDILEFVPCFCGCESAGHRANAHCFVQSRNEDGSVAAWEPHGLGCAVCIDVARDSMQLSASGASVSDVRDAIEAKYAARFPRMTPTPPVPAN
ncbi:MAG: hypothetical protein OXF27_04280 [Acidobacteria bacterium]|nr:hypothetical protein [Acidobacteriota bacterium]